MSHPTEEVLVLLATGIAVVVATIGVARVIGGLLGVDGIFLISCILIVITLIFLLESL